MTRLLSPVAELCVKLTTKTLQLFGVPEQRPGLTEEELKSIFNLGADEGVIHRDERQLLHKVIEFGDKTVRDIMVPRTKIVALPETASFDDVRLLLREHKLSRLPVYRGSLDNVVGILHAKDLFDLSDEEEKNFELSKFVDPPFLVPEFKRAEDLFREMRRRHTHMAIVVDEHGGTAGLATIENAIEELLGQIQDEFDEEKPGFEPAGERTFVLEGSLRLDGLEEQFGIKLPRDEAETIAGHLMLRFGRIPRKGERWKGRFADFVIEEATPTAIRRIKMILPLAAREAGGPLSAPRPVTLIRGRRHRPRGRRRRGLDPRGRRSAARLRGGPSSAAAPRRPRAIPCRNGPSRRSARTASPSRAPSARRSARASSPSTCGCGRLSTSTPTCGRCGTSPPSRAGSREWTSSSCARTPRTSTPGSSTPSFPASSSRSRSSRMPPRRASPDSPSSTPAPTDAAASPRSTRRTS